MPALSNLVLNDGQATPVAHTFRPKSNDLRTTVYEDRSIGIPIGFPRIVINTEDTPVIRKVTYAVSVPTLEAPAGANAGGFTPAAKVAYTHRANVEFKLPQRGTAQERKNLKAYLTQLLITRLVADMIEDGDEITG